MPGKRPEPLGECPLPCKSDIVLYHGTPRRNVEAILHEGLRGRELSHHPMPSGGWGGVQASVPRLFVTFYPEDARRYGEVIEIHLPEDHYPGEFMCGRAVTLWGRQVVLFWDRWGSPCLVFEGEGTLISPKCLTYDPEDQPEVPEVEKEEEDPEGGEE